MTAIGEQSLRWFSAAERVEAEPDLPALVRDHSGLLYRVALSVLRNPAEAEDVVQDAFVRVLQRRRELGAIVEMRPWLVRIAWNLALDRRRRIRPEQMDEAFAAALVARGTPADDALAEAARIARVLAAMERLPTREREALLLSAMDELSTAETWWRGAVCGAATATLAVGVVLFAQHRSHAMPQVSQTIARVAPAPNAALLATAYAKGSVAANGPGTPCATRALPRAQLAAAPPRMQLPAAPTPAELRAATTAPSKPAPELPLTAQERELVRLARTVDPKQLAALNEEAQARQEAQQAEEFKKFFAPPPAPAPPPEAPAENE